MSTPTLAPLLNSSVLTTLRPRNSVPASPSAPDQPTADDRQPSASGSTALAVSTTTHRDDSVVTQRQLDLGNDHLALHLFTTRAMSMAQRLTATDGHAVMDLTSSVAAAIGGSVHRGVVPE